MKKHSLYHFSDAHGSFHVNRPSDQGVLYFPLVNEQAFMSAISPDLAGDIKLDQHSFLTIPVAYEDLHLSRATRNFWFGFRSKGDPVLWSVAGRSVWQRVNKSDETSEMEAGLLWQRVTRTNKKLGLHTRVLSFVPAGNFNFEVMHVEVKNISRKPITVTGTSAIPLYGRSADNLRDHRHVTSLLHRLKREKFGINLTPTMTFNERGHLINSTSYYVIGVDEKGGAPTGIFPTEISFIGEGGDLERPLALMENRAPQTRINETDQGKEAIGALQFRSVTLKPGASTTYTLLLGIDRQPTDHEQLIHDFTGPEKVQAHWLRTKQFWDEKLSTIVFETGDQDFNAWVRWVQVQPVLRKLFGCSFLPDFDYGRGGRGWRDLWQDCLALLLQSPEEVRDDILHNFGGVRMDGSNATIIGRKKIGEKWFPEFIADRNNIARTWMDHGVWPFLTTLLYLNQTGDWNALLEKAPYFRDALTHRGKKVDPNWATNKNAKPVAGTILEHMLVELVVQFFNVGEHNIIRLEDADWNDGLDMAHRRGESVAFTNMYGGNMAALADLLEMLMNKHAWKDAEIASELLLLIVGSKNSVDYNDASAKQKRLAEYFAVVADGISGKKISVSIEDLVRDLREKAKWIKDHVNNAEWVSYGGEAWYNGYYDDEGHRVEGKNGDGRIRMTLSGQVYPIMAGIADDARIKSVIAAVNKHLFDAKLNGFRLNTDFGAIQPTLGRAFSFAYGEKENGAVFSHMAVMYANALYQRDFSEEGFRVLNSLFEMAKNSARSRIFPGLPEYFNNEGRGRYMYLTGSASWYVLTLLTQAFGVRGLNGDLLIAPKLAPEQFDKKGRASVVVRFAGSEVRVNFVNPNRVAANRIRVEDVKSDQVEVSYERMSEKEVLIRRDVISTKKNWIIEVKLGS